MNPVQSKNNGLMLAAIVAIAVAGGYLLARCTGGADTHAPASSQGTQSTQPAEVTVSEAALQTMQIGLEKVEAGQLGALIDAPADVVAGPDGEALVAARASGTVTRVHKRLGQPVRAGETLAVVQSSEAQAIAADRKTAESRLTLASSVLERERTLYEQRVTPRQDLETAQAAFDSARADANRARAIASNAQVAEDGSMAVVSPIAGRITEATIALGSHVSPDSILFRVADRRFVLLQAAVPASDAAKINPHDPARVSMGDGTTLKAQVVSVTPTVNDRTRAATVTLSLLPDQQLPAMGDAVRVSIAIRAGAAAGLVVPSDAIQSIAGKPSVFVRTAHGFAVRAVQIAARNGASTLVASGVQAGEIIAASNTFLLKAELNKGAEEDEE